MKVGDIVKLSPRATFATERAKRRRAIIVGGGKPRRSGVVVWRIRWDGNGPRSSNGFAEDYLVLADEDWSDWSI